MRIYLIGFMGSGKTLRGRELSHKLKLPFFDLDEQVENSEGKTIPQIFAEDGEEHFRHKETEVLHILTESHTSFVLACGGGAPCFNNNIEYMNSSGVTAWLNPSIDSLFKRLLKERDQRPLLKGLSDNQLRGFILRKYSDRKIYYEQAKVIVDEEHMSIDSLIEKIFHA